MIKKNIVIDGHSHIGNDYFHGFTDLYKYIELMNETGIDYGLLMPTPSPVKLINLIKAKYLGWYIYKNEIIYYSDVHHNNLENPYKEVNYEYFELIKKTGKNNLFFIPLVHPMLDNVEYLKKILVELDPVAFKIHGVGSGIDPKKIPMEFTNFLKNYDIPLIVHTDYDNGNNILRYDTYLLRNLNMATQWVKYLNDNNIKAILNHGCALDQKALGQINKSSLIKVGIGPDLIIEHDVDRLNFNNNTIEYLKTLKKTLSSNKVIFDIDYNWNINPYTSQMDLCYTERIENIWGDNESQKQIYSSNILEHFDKLKIKIKKEGISNGKIK